MKDVSQKIRKVEPLIRAKKAAMDREASELARIRNEKIAVVREMKLKQRKYMEGVQQLNDVRTSAARENLETLERGLDLVKADWENLFRQVRALESKERVQTALVLRAQTELKAVEKLKERYLEELKKSFRKSEQNQQDEQSLRKFYDRH